MSYLEQIEEIENLCYTDQKDEAKDKIQFFVDNLIKEQNVKDSFLPILQGMLISLEKKDYISVADYLEFGIKPLLYDQVYRQEVLYEIPYCVPDIKEDIFYMPSFLDDELCICMKCNDEIVRLNSIFSPINETEKVIEKLKIRTTTPVVCIFGIGTGILAEKILNRLSYDSKLIIYEPDNKIINYCTLCSEAADSSDQERHISKRIKSVLDDKRTILCIEEESKIEFRYKLEQYVDFTGLAGLVVIKNTGYTYVYPKSCLNFYKALNYYRDRYLTNKNTKNYFRDDNISNFLRNIWMCKSMILSTDLAKNFPAEVPIIIVSAGPSLDKNIEVLRQAKGHALIFAVDSAVKYLLKRGIIPDLTITVDSRKPASNFETEVSQKIPCIFGANSNPEIVANHKGFFIFLDGQSGYIENILNSMGKQTGRNIGFGGSVATAAFSMSFKFGTKKIILVGQDLAYVNGVTHAGGTSDNATYATSIVEGYDGNDVTTRGDWLDYLRWFEEAIITLKEGGFDVTVIDATEGGAKIHGSQIMTLQQAIDEMKGENGNLPEYDFERELKKLDFVLDAGEYVEFCKRHHENIEQLHKLEIETKNASELCSKLLIGIRNGKVSDDYIRKQNKKLKSIRKKYEKSPFVEVVNEYSDTNVLDDVAKLELQEGDAKMTQANLVEIMKITFASISNSINRVYMIAKEYEDLLE